MKMLVFEILRDVANALVRKALNVCCSTFLDQLRTSVVLTLTISFYVILETQYSGGGGGGQKNGAIPEVRLKSSVARDL